MNTGTKLIAGSLGLLLTVVIVYLWLVVHDRKPHLPDLERRSSKAGAQAAEYTRAQKLVEYHRAQITSSPDELSNYVVLARVYLKEARITMLHHVYLPSVGYLLDEVLRREADHFEATVMKATMLMTLHRFQEAHTLARKAVALAPHSAFAYGVLCDALVELGEYDEAVRACDRMLSIRPDLRSYARAAYLREIHGDLPGARAAMLMAAEAGVWGSEERAWALYNLGKLHLAGGNADTAGMLFEGILEERPEYAYALNGLAQIKAAEGDWDEAIKLLNAAYEACPDHAFYEQLVILYRLVGRDLEAEHALQFVLKEFSDHVEEGWNIDHEFAVFCADNGTHLEQAVERARRDYDRRPGNIDAQQAYAWALHRSGETTRAVPLIESAMRLGTQDPRLLFRAGMIFNVAGETAKAGEFTRRALAVAPHLRLLYSNVAVTAETLSRIVALPTEMEG